MAGRASAWNAGHRGFESCLRQLIFSLEKKGVVFRRSCILCLVLLNEFTWKQIQPTSELVEDFKAYVDKL